MKPFVGVDVGGTNLRAAVVELDTGRVLAQRRCPTQAHEGQAAVIERMTALVETVAAESGHAADQLGGLGVGVPGTPDIDTGDEAGPIGLRCGPVKG